MVRDERTLPCGCKEYLNMYGEWKIWDWVCETHKKWKPWIIEQYKKEGYHGMK